jgi:hypothetical protein
MDGACAAAVSAALDQRWTLPPPCRRSRPHSEDRPTASSGRRAQSPLQLPSRRYGGAGGRAHLCKGAAQGTAGQLRPTSQEQVGPGATTGLLLSLLNVPAIVRARTEQVVVHSRGHRSPLLRCCGFTSARPSSARGRGAPLSALERAATARALLHAGIMRSECWSMLVNVGRCWSMLVNVGQRQCVGQQCCMVLIWC